MKVEDELRMLNNELVEELEKVKVRNAHLEALVNELTDEIDGLKEHLGQGPDNQIREQNKLLRQLLKVVL